MPGRSKQVMYLTLEDFEKKRISHPSIYGDHKLQQCAFIDEEGDLVFHEETYIACMRDLRHGTNDGRTATEDHAERTAGGTFRRRRRH